MHIPRRLKSSSVTFSDYRSIKWAIKLLCEAAFRFSNLSCLNMNPAESGLPAPPIGVQKFKLSYVKFESSSESRIFEKMTVVRLLIRVGIFYDNYLSAPYYALPWTDTTWQWFESRLTDETNPSCTRNGRNIEGWKGHVSRPFSQMRVWMTKGFGRQCKMRKI